MAINTPSGGDEELRSRLKGLTPEEKSRLLEMLKQDKKKDEDEQENIEPNIELFGNKEAILKDLKENHVKVEENVEMLGYRGKKVHVDLPPEGNFGGFKFDYFVSDDQVRREDLESNPELKEKTYPINEICNLLYAMNNYLYEKGEGYDGDDIDYYDLMENGYDDFRFFAGEYFNEISGLRLDRDKYDNRSYWSRDKNGKLVGLHQKFHFGNHRGYGKLFLKVDD